jgi:hypothetical protein
MAKPKPKVKVRYREQRQCWEVDARRINKGRPTFLTEEEAQEHASALVKEHGQDLPDLGENRDIIGSAGYPSRSSNRERSPASSTS